MSYRRWGIVAWFIVELVLAILIRGTGGGNLVNFGPAIVASVAVAIGLSLALACLAVGIAVLFRRRWNDSGFYLGCTAAFAVLTGWIFHSLNSN